MYANSELYRFPLKYTVNKKQVGYELLTHSPDLFFPENLEIRRGQHNSIKIERISELE